jgi:hypothetical protein
MHPPLGWLSWRRSGIVANMRHSLPAAPDLDVSDRFVSTAGSEVAGQHAYQGGEMNRGIIGAIIGVLVIIILVIVILQMT